MGIRPLSVMDSSVFAVLSRSARLWFWFNSESAFRPQNCLQWALPRPKVESAAHDFVMSSPVNCSALHLRYAGLACTRSVSGNKSPRMSGPSPLRTRASDRQCSQLIPFLHN